MARAGALPVRACMARAGALPVRTCMAGAEALPVRAFMARAKHFGQHTLWLLLLYKKRSL